MVRGSARNTDISGHTTAAARSYIDSAQLPPPHPSPLPANAGEREPGSSHMSRQEANAAFARSSFLYGGNAGYLEDLQARFEASPQALDAE